MVRSMRYWCEATEVIERIDNRGNARVTDLGEKLLGQESWDPYLEDPGTLWLLHWQLVRNPSHSSTWHLAFTRWNSVRFTREKLVDKISNPGEEYGICWLNRQKTSTRTVSEPDGNGGRRYRKRKTIKIRPREEWIAVPVPACLPRALVDRARTTMDNNKGAERKYLAREWELRGLVRCSCGSKMGTHTTQPRGGHVYHYYKCRGRSPLSRSGLCKQGALRASAVEPLVWSFVSGLLRDPERIRVGMERLIDQEKNTGRGDPERESRAWVEKLAECDRLRKAYQQQAAGLMTMEELGAMLKDLEETRRVAEAELKGVEARRGRVEALENDRDDLLQYVAGSVPEALDNLTGQERNGLYRMLRLEVTPSPEGYEVRGAFCPLELPPLKTLKVTTSNSTSRLAAKAGPDFSKANRVQPRWLQANYWRGFSVVSNDKQFSLETSRYTSS